MIRTVMQVVQVHRTSGSLHCIVVVMRTVISCRAVGRRTTRVAVGGWPIVLVTGQHRMNVVHWKVEEEELIRHGIESSLGIDIFSSNLSWATKENRNYVFIIVFPRVFPTSPTFCLGN